MELGDLINGIQALKTLGIKLPKGAQIDGKNGSNDSLPVIDLTKSHEERILLIRLAN